MAQSWAKVSYMQFMHTVSRVLVCLWMAGVGAAGHAQSASTPFGTPGQFAVSPSGAATYRIPIEVPPGVAGMAPKLELVYNSQSGNGILGMGWGLSGLSSINRCPRTMASDGARGSVNFDANDRFCLDGQRLILVSGTYGAAGSEYRTELESFSQIVAVGSAGTGPASFVVKTKGGLTIEYGNTEDSRIEAVKAAGSVATWPTGSVQAWAQNKITDVKGNYLTVSYSEDAAKGSYMPSRIDYTGNANSSPAVVPSLAVVFVPSNTARLDVMTGYQGGATFATTQRLGKIQTYQGNSLVKEYQLDYAAQSSAVDRSQLTAVTECDGGGACLPPTAFQWGRERAVILPPKGALWLKDQYSINKGWENNSTYPRQLVDVNGDGLPDVVGFANSGVYVAIGTGQGFADATIWLNGQYGVSQGWKDNATFPRRLVDVDGDGLPDIVGFSTSGVYVSLNTGKNFAQPTYWLNGQFGTTQGWVDGDSFPREIVDVDGDGLPDIVGFAKSGVYVALNMGKKFASATIWRKDQYGPNQGWKANSTHPRYLVDVNGDGMPDIVGFGGSDVYVALNTGKEFAGATIWRKSQFGLNQGWKTNSAYPRLLADVNGDGLPDIVGFGGSDVYVALNTGKEFAVATIWRKGQYGVTQGWVDSDRNPREVADINGDGLPDIVGFGNASVYVAINAGDGFSAPTVWLKDQYCVTQGWSSNSTYPRSLADMNGDGLLDIVGFGGGGVSVAVNSHDALHNFVAGITSTAKESHVSYATLVVGNVYIRDTGRNKAEFPKIDVIAPIHVVSNVVHLYAPFAPLRVAASDLRANKPVSPTADVISQTQVVNEGRQGGGLVGVRVGVGREEQYTYGGLKAELGTGRGMLGFRWVKSVDLTNQVERYTEFLQDYPYTAAPTLVEYRKLYSDNSMPSFVPVLATSVPVGYSTDNASVLKRNTITYQCIDPATAGACSVAAGKRYFVYPASTDEQAWDLDGSAYPSVTETLSYGANPDGQFYGEVASVKRSTSDGASQTTVNEYYPADTTRWLFGRLKTSTVTSTTP